MLYSKIQKHPDVIDLKMVLCSDHSFSISATQRMANEHWTNRFLSTPRFSSIARVPQMREPIQWKLQNPYVYLSRSFSHALFCTIHLSGKPARYRSLSSFPIEQAISLRYSWQNIPQHDCRCERASGLAYLFRLKETNKKLIFLTNNFLLPAITIAQLFKSRWQIDMFQIISVTLFEKQPLLQVLTDFKEQELDDDNAIQLNLFK